jgi:hypothetical protein
MLHANVSIGIRRQHSAVLRPYALRQVPRTLRHVGRRAESAFELRESRGKVPHRRRLLDDPETT